MVNQPEQENAAVPMQLSRVQFLEIELAITKLKLFDEQAARLRQLLVAAHQASMTTAGLELGRNYRLDPDTSTATPE